MDYLYIISKKNKILKIKIRRETATSWVVARSRKVGHSYFRYISKQSKKYHTSLESVLSILESRLEKEIKVVSDKLYNLSLAKDAAIDINIPALERTGFIKEVDVF